MEKLSYVVRCVCVCVLSPILFSCMYKIYTHNIIINPRGLLVFCQKVHCCLTFLAKIVPEEKVQV